MGGGAKVDVDETIPTDFCDITVSAKDNDTTNWADPIMGLRWSVPLLESVTGTFRGDIGGFGASSQLDWGLVGDVRYRLSWHPWSTQPYLAAGYRIVAFDRSPDTAEVDMQLRGPIVGMGFIF